MDDAKLKILIQAQDDASKKFKELEGNLNKLKDTTKALGTAALAMGAAIVAGAALSIKTYAELGSEIHDLALATGFSTEAVSEWRHALKQSGSDTSQLQVAIKTMSSAIVDADNNLVTAQRAFDELGLSYKDLLELAPEKQFEAIVVALGNMRNDTLRAATAQDVFGRSAMNLLPLFAEGKEGIAALRKEAHELGIVFDQDAANQADALGDSLHSLSESFNGVKIAIAQNLAPVLDPLLRGVKDILVGFRNWADANPELARALTTLGTGAGLLLTALGGVLLILPKLLLSIRAVTTAFIALRAATTGLSLSFLGPVGIVAAAVIALTAFNGASDGVYRFENSVSDTITPVRGLTDAEIELGEAAVEAMLAQSRLNTQVEDVTSLAEFTEITKASKQALAEATWTLDGLTYKTQLYSNAEVEAAREVGAFIRKLDPDLTNALKRASDIELQEAQTTHDKKMSMLDAEYALKLRTLDAETAAQVDAIQAQIDELNAQTDKENRALEEQAEQRRLVELRQAMDSAETDEEYERAQQAYHDYLAQIERNNVLRERDDKREALRREIDDIRANAAQRQEDFQAEYDERKIQLDTQLGEQLARIAEETAALEIAYGLRTAETQEFVDEVNRITAQLQDRVIHVTTVYNESGGGGEGVGGEAEGENGGGEGGVEHGVNPGAGMWGFQHGGIIDEPTLLYGLRSRRPYALAGEAGREYVTPDGSGNIHVHVELDGRELTHIILDRAGHILKSQGVY